MYVYIGAQICITCVYIYNYSFVSNIIQSNDVLLVYFVYA